MLAGVSAKILLPYFFQVNATCHTETTDVFLMFKTECSLGILNWKLLISRETAYFCFILRKKIYLRGVLAVLDCNKNIWNLTSESPKLILMLSKFF